jgi:hypothetical protein
MIQFACQYYKTVLLELLCSDVNVSAKVRRIRMLVRRIELGEWISLVAACPPTLLAVRASNIALYSFYSLHFSL